MKFGILGAGVVGLTTAIELQNQFPHNNVTIIADKFGNETTSYVAAGIFRPGTSFNGPNETITRQWINDAYNYWNEICSSSEGSLAGVTRLGVYAFSKTNPEIVRNRFLEKLVPLYRPCTEPELDLCPGQWKYGSYYETLLTDFTIFHEWAIKKFLAANGQIKTQQITSLNSISGTYDIIINCTGLEARTLCNDYKVVPIRGQVLKVHAPWIKTAFYAENDTYIIPGFRGEVTLGGIRQYEDWNCQLSKHDSFGIKARCQQLLPSLVTAKLVREAVGLRPHRDVVRVEMEILNQQKFVHNYGHGGYGVTTSPGTAKYAIHLVRDLIRCSGSKL